MTTTPTLAERQAALAAEQKAIDRDLLALVENARKALGDLDLKAVAKAAAALPEGDPLKDSLGHVPAVIGQVQQTADGIAERLNRAIAS